MAGRAQPETADALVIGGGLAGASVAIHLARAGRAVTLLEQQPGPHDKVCGEFLSHEALFYLRQLGISPEALGAVPITHVRFAGGGRAIARPLPFPAMSLTRRTLDEALLAAASASGVLVVRQRAESLERAGDLWHAGLADGTEVSAPAAFLATGKHDLRGHPRPPGRQNGLLGLKMYFRLAPEEAALLRQYVELVTFPGGYAGLQPVEGSLANLCALIEGAAYRHLGGDWSAMLAHMTNANSHLARRLAGAEPQLSRPLAIAHIPYGLVRRQAGGEGLWLLGDQAAVIPSFSGDGMSIALHTAHAAATAYFCGDSAQVFAGFLHRQLRHQVNRATLLSRMLVSPAGSRVAGVALRLAPPLLTLAARATRISARSLARP